MAFQISTEVVDSVGDAGYQTASAIDKDGNHHIIHSDSNDDVRYTRWDGAAWVKADGTAGYDTFSPTNPAQLGIDIDLDGNAHLIWHDVVGKGSVNLVYTRWDGSNWVEADGTTGQETVDSTTADDFLDIKVDLNTKRAKIAYSDGTDLFYIQWNGSSWTKADNSTAGPEEPDTSGNTFGKPSLALDFNNAPHIAYKDVTANSVIHIKYTGGSWTKSTAVSADTPESPSIDIDDNDDPHIAYIDSSNSRLRYTRFVSGSWREADGTTVGNSLVSNDANSQVPKLKVFQYSGRIVSDTNSSGVRGYNYNLDGNLWEQVTIDGSSTNSPSLALDSKDLMHVAYQSSGLDLKAAQLGNSVKQWSFPEKIKIVAGQQLDGVHGISVDDVISLTRISIDQDSAKYSEDGTNTAHVSNNRLRINLFANGEMKLDVVTAYYGNFNNSRATINGNIGDNFYTFLDIARTVGGSVYQDFSKTTSDFNAPYFGGATQLFGTGANHIIKSIASADPINISSMPNTINVIIGGKLDGVNSLSEDDVLTMRKINETGTQVRYSETGSLGVNQTTNRIVLIFKADASNNGTFEVNMFNSGYSSSQKMGSVKNAAGSAFTDSQYTLNDIAPATASGAKYDDFVKTTDFFSNLLGGAANMFGTGGSDVFKAIFATGGADTTPPVFTVAPALNNIAGTTADVDATIDEDGTMYGVVVPDGAGAPSSAQVKAGQDSTGTPVAAGFSDSQAMTGTVSNTISFSNLSSETAYDVYVVAEDDEGSPNIQAAPVKLDLTTADVTPPVFTVAPALNNIAGTTADVDATIDEDGTMYGVIVPDGAGAPSSAQVVAGQDSTGTPVAAGFSDSQAMTGTVSNTISFSNLTSETDYDVYVVAEDDEGTPNVQAAPVKLDLTTADITAPTFQGGTPSLSSQVADGVDVDVEIDEDGTAYLVVVPDGDPAPSSAQVKAGQDSTSTPVGAGLAKSVALTASTPDSMNLTGLTQAEYDIYVVAEDDEGTPNIQASPTKLDLDLAPPGYLNSTPSLSNLVVDGADVDFEIDENGTGYVVVVADGATAPTPAEVKAGTGSGGSGELFSDNIALTASTPDAISITGLAPALYDVYVVSEDTLGNLEASVNLLNLDIAKPNYADGYPRLDNVQDTTVDVLIEIDEAGTGWSVVVEDDSAPPSKAQIKAGQDGSGAAAISSDTGALTADTEDTHNHTGLTIGVNYDVWVLTEDTAGNSRDAVRLDLNRVPVVPNPVPVSADTMFGTLTRTSRRIDTDTFISLPARWGVLSGETLVGVTTGSPGILNKFPLTDFLGTDYESQDLKIGRITTLETPGTRVTVNLEGYVEGIVKNEDLIVSVESGEEGKLRSANGATPGTYEIVARCQSVDNDLQSMTWVLLSPRSIVVS